jgi:transaldolase
MKIFLDTANIGEVREAMAAGLLDGVTTNPTLIAKEKRPFEAVIREICEVCPGPVSAECMSEEAAQIIPEARRLTKIAPNIVVKIPVTREGLKAVSSLSKEGIRTNVTLCFSAVQALLAAKSGASYVSPFVGRLDDAGHIGMQIIQDIRTIYRNYSLATEIIVASIRHPLHVLEAARMGADIATMPFAVFQRLFQHPLTDIGIARFIQDYKKIPG